MDEYITKKEFELVCKNYDKKFTEQEKDVSSLKRIYEVIQNLTISIERNVTETKFMREKIDNMESRLKELEGNPKKRYEQVVSLLISLIVGAVMGFVFVKIGLK